MGLLLLTAAPAMAQVDLEPEPMRYVLPDGQSLRVRAYASVLTQLSRINNGDVLSVGSQAVLLVNRRAWLGVYSLATVTPMRDIVWNQPGTLPERYDEFTEVGGVLGYSFRPKRAIHLALSSRIGAGVLESDFLGNLSATTFIVQPKADVELNLFRWLRASVGVGYRLVNNNSPLIQQNQLSSPTLSLGVSVGWFD